MRENNNNNNNNNFLTFQSNFTAQTAKNSLSSKKRVFWLGTDGRNMLAIRPSKETPGTIHLLPCHVKHTGSANATKHWVVNAGEVDGTKVAHFRGRKLVGKGVSLPEGYSGHVLMVTDEVPKGAIEKSKGNRPLEEEEGEGEREVKICKGLANFDDVVVWGHDIAPEEGGEYVVKGMDEWVGLASKIHSFADEDEDEE